MSRWQRVSARTGHLNDIAAMTDGRLVAVGAKSTVSISMDGGFHWQKHSLGDDGWTALNRICQAPSGKLYALACQGLYSSATGDSWFHVASSATNDALTFASDQLHIAQDETLYVCATDYNGRADKSRSSVARSPDGFSWSTIRFSDEYAFFGPVVTFGDAEIVVGNVHHLERFDGQAWHREPELPFPNVSDLRWDDGELWATSGGYPGGVFVSGDRGRTWTQCCKTHASMTRLSVDKNTVCAVGQDEIAVSRDRGETWDTTNVETRLLGITAHGDGTVVAVGEDGTVILGHCD